MRVAAAAYPMDPVTSFDAWAAKAAAWVEDARADLLVFPEYGAMELAHLDGAATAADLEASLHAAARHGPAAQEVWADLARRHACHILAPSGPWDAGGPRPVNRAWLHGPQGTLGYQDKQIMTLFERDWDLRPGDPLRTFRLGPFTVGVLICYDAEFAALGEALITAGVDLLLVPSCTDAASGWARVRVGAMARALEGQCVAVHAPTVGACPWSPAVDENHGRAALYAPPDLGFPATGVVVEGAWDAPGWVRAKVDPGAVARLRNSGAVRGHAHRAEAAAAVRRIRP
ncbi:carbon-nitrogen hydrolase family protein [Jannaschia seohaensis]|uniref:Predicted amidohydrolase n=1 Tax=Jannaschia seohaensis TaxID=475081 RepID=A0A2Y9C2K0_9RHOB|nr:carbon-nitrogen hydrolase family protein [Jannaschia seohaensis]PWJ15003.1 putative amidohydrolase [Jannaschia seohaensis]SSA49852.1 Predicted amidohydrolase [Jannaschia seohaensis]